VLFHAGVEGNIGPPGATGIPGNPGAVGPVGECTNSLKLKSLTLVNIN